MEQSRQGRETSSLKSPRDSEQQVLLLPTWIISWMGTLAQESAVHHLRSAPSIYLSAKE